MKNLLLAAAVCTLFAACSNPSSTSNTTAAKGDTSANGMKAGDHTLEPVFQDSTYQLTGIAVSPQGKVYINYPRWGGPYRYAVVAVNGMKQSAPFPDTTTNAWDESKPGANKWVCVQSLYFDDAGTMWVLDPSAPQLKNIKGGGAKLVKMGADGKMERSYNLGGALTDTSYANDVRIDTKLNYAYITDSKCGGIVVLNLATGKVREVLRGHPSTLSDPAFKFVIDGRELMKTEVKAGQTITKPAKFNSDGIALTPDGAYLYYKPLSDDKLYRIKTEYLRDEAMKDADLGSKVEDLGHFCTTDGMIFDKDGNLYLGDLQNYRIVRLDKNLKLTELVKSESLIWPDSYAIQGGYLYITCSQINKQPDYNEGVNKRTTPYAVYRIKL